MPGLHPQSTVRSGPINREIIHWSQPLLPAVAERLLDMADRQNDVIDLQSWLCVVPGRRAGRFLLTELLRQANESGAPLLPPNICTPGQAVDQLLAAVPFDHDSALADACTVELAWIEALRRCDADILYPLLPQPPAEGDLIAWHHLAQTIAGLHETLAGARLHFAEVVDRAQRYEMFQEGDRWHALSQLHDRYRQVLQQLQLIDRHEHREQALTAADSLTEQSARVALIGVVELNLLQRDTLGATALAGITSFIHATEEHENRFDDFGCVQRDAWTDATINGDNITITIAERPADQAQQTIAAISRHAPDHAVDDIVIGLGDPSLAGPIARAARWAGLNLHNAAGIPINRTTPFRLLQLLTEFIADPLLTHFAALIRHPDLDRWLHHTLAPTDGDSRAARPWLKQLDTYQSDYLQQRVTGQWLGPAAHHRDLSTVNDALRNCLAPLQQSHVQPCHHWCDAVRAFFSVMYDPAFESSPGSISARHRRSALESIERAISTVELAHPALQPTVDAATALRLILAQLQQPIAEELRDDQIEMLGWLELHTDPAAVQIITSFNDGFIPSSASEDIFLPNTLRRILALPDNDSRLARDAYYMQVARHCRRHVHVIAGRRNANDDPLTPSRLLLRGDDDLLTHRAGQLFSEGVTTDTVRPAGLARPRSDTDFRIPTLPKNITPPSSMRITDFRAYLNCPYRYALTRLLGCQRLNDQAREIDALNFGNLLHDTLNLFGRDARLAQSTDEDAIRAALLGTFNDLAKPRYGTEPPTAVRIQLAMIRQRLIRFAELQARLRRDGWEILHTEIEIASDITLDVSGQEPMPLRGKIDRVDVNASSGSFRIIDYKSGDSAHKPLQTHHGGRKTLPDADDTKWTDLQLPLYNYIARAAGIVSGDAQLGYILLPKDTAGIAFESAPWTPAHLEHGLDTARDVVRAIRAGRFEPNLDARLGDDAARLLHTEYYGLTDDDTTNIAEADA